MEPIKRKDTTACRIAESLITILENDLFRQKKHTKELNEKIAGMYNCSERQARRYIKEAREEILRMKLQAKEKCFESAIMDREFIIKKALSKGNLKTALAGMKDRDKLRGFYEEKIILATSDVDVSKLTDEDLIKLANQGDDTTN